MHDHLSNAKRVKNDEFYTCRADIDAELGHHSSSFYGKVVYCNCDDEGSAFKDYFIENFHTLGLQGLCCTGIAGMCFEYDGSKMTMTKVDGDFRSSDSLRFLDQADIVVSNPPFSLFREYVELLIDSDKDFLIIGNKNAISYKKVFTAVKDGRMRLGYTSPNYFDTPTEPVNLQGLCRWFTTLSTPDKTYWTPTATMGCEDVVGYDLYPAKNYDKVCLLPKVFDGLAGVPLTAIDKLDPNEFELVDLIARYAVIDHSYDTPGHQLTEINGKPRFSRLVIKRINKYNVP